MLRAVGSKPISSAQAPANQAALKQAMLIFKASVDFNAGNTDTAIPIVLPSGFTRYRVAEVRISGASASLTTATVGVFTAAAGGGIAVVAAGSPITVSSNAENTNNNAQNMTVIGTNTITLNAATLFVRVATPQGSAATGVVAIIIEPLS